MTISKRQSYGEIYDRMTAAVAEECFLEAAWLAYAIIEDRANQALAWSGGPLLNKRGVRIPRPGLAAKLKRLITRLDVDVQLKGAMRGADVIDEALAWKADRDDFAHALANKLRPWSQLKEEAKVLAERGAIVARNLSSAGLRLRRKKVRSGRRKSVV